MQQKNFKSNLAAALSKSDPREVLKHVYFKEGKAVATDAHVLVESPLSIHGFSDSESENLEGYCMSIDQFKRIKAFHRIEVDAKGVVTCFSKDGSKTTEILKPMSEVGRYPDYKRVIPTNVEAIESIGLDFNLLNRVKELLVKEGKTKSAKFTFTGHNRGVLINDGSGQIILIVPCIVNV